MLNLVLITTLTLIQHMTHLRHLHTHVTSRLTRFNHLIDSHNRLCLLHLQAMAMPADYFPFIPESQEEIYLSVLTDTPFHSHRQLLFAFYKACHAFLQKSSHSHMRHPSFLSNEEVNSTRAFFIALANYSVSNIMLTFSLQLNIINLHVTFRHVMT